MFPAIVAWALRIPPYAGRRPVCGAGRLSGGRPGAIARAARGGAAGRAHAGAANGGNAQVTRLSASTVGQPAPAGQAGQPEPDGSLLLPGPPGPVERLMSTVIRKLAQPKVAVAISGAGLLLGMLVGATAPNPETLIVRLPLSHLLPSLQHQL